MPDRAYFGQKDAQQLFVIQKMVKDLNFDIETLRSVMRCGISGDSRPYATNEERNERSSAHNDGPERASREKYDFNCITKGK